MHVPVRVTYHSSEIRWTTCHVANRRSWGLSQVSLGFLGCIKSNNQNGVFLRKPFCAAALKFEPFFLTTHLGPILGGPLQLLAYIDPRHLPVFGYHFRNPVAYSSLEAAGAASLPVGLRAQLLIGGSSVSNLMRRAHRMCFKGQESTWFCCK